MSRNFELMQQGEIKPDNSFGPERRILSQVQIDTRLAKKPPLPVETVAREEFTKLVQKIFLLGDKQSPRAVVFAGVDSGSGCSSICVNAGRILAAQNVGSICMVDANLHTPSLPESLGVTNHFGFTDSLRQEAKICAFVKPVGPENLWLLSCGSLAAESAGRLNADTLKFRLDELRAAFDYVLIDSPSLGKYTDGVALGRVSDGLVLIIEANSTRRESASNVMRTLRAANISILGAVLNRRTFPIPNALYQRL